MISLTCAQQALVRVGEHVLVPAARPGRAREVDAEAVREFVGLLDTDPKDSSLTVRASPAQGLRASEVRHRVVPSFAEREPALGHLDFWAAASLAHRLPAPVGPMIIRIHE